MLRNYLLIAYRNLLRHKVFSLINILGLAIGMAACMLILQYVVYQFSYDGFHINKENIYRIVLGEDVPGRQVTPPALGPGLMSEFPQVVATARLQKQSGIVTYEEKIFSEENMYWVDAAFLNMFNYPVVKGNAADALRQPNTVVISESTAKKYFGNIDPIGQTLKLDSYSGTFEFQVTGILEDIPENSHLQFNILFAYATARGEEVETAWNWRDFYTYVLLAPQADPKVLEMNLPNWAQNLSEEGEVYEEFYLQPLKEIHLSTAIKEARGTDLNVVYFLLLLALFIIIIAWINYINLSTARSADRAKEVGVRKSIGANRYQIVRQFLLETVLLNSLAILLAFTMVQLSLPYFRQLTSLELHVGLWNNFYFWTSIIGLIAIGTLLAGSYPAFLLSSYKPVAVLKGKNIKLAKNLSLRKSLIIFQFAASVFLTAGTFTMYQQIRYMRNEDLGVNIDQTLVIHGPKTLTDSATFVNQWNLFKMKLENMASISHVTASDAVPSKGFKRYTVSVKSIDNQEAETTVSKVYALARVEADFIESFGFTVLAGRNFSAELKSDNETVVLNEESTKLLGFTDPQMAVGKQITVGKKLFSVIGVIKNYHHDFLHNDYFPTIFQLNPAEIRYFSLKVNTGDNSSPLQEIIASIKNEWEKLYPGNPFEYFFLEDAFNAQYESDQRQGKIIGLFAFLAIFIACLGLFGLASFTTAQRTKEIGVRKVHGASVSNILGLISKDYLKLLLIANLFAWPLTWWAMNEWLQSYAFRIQINLWLFILPSLLVVLIALFTVSSQTWKAARINPVNSLKYE